MLAPMWIANWDSVIIAVQGAEKLPEWKHWITVVVVTAFYFPHVVLTGISYTNGIPTCIPYPTRIPPKSQFSTWPLTSCLWMVGHHCTIYTYVDVVLVGWFGSSILWDSHPYPTQIPLVCSTLGWPPPAPSACIYVYLGHIHPVEPPGSHFLAFCKSGIPMWQGRHNVGFPCGNPIWYLAFQVELLVEGVQPQRLIYRVPELASPWSPGLLVYYIGLT